VKNPVKKIIAINILIKPNRKDKMSFVLKLRLTLTKIGKIGRIQGVNIDITPVVNEINGRISI